MNRSSREAKNPGGGEWLTVGQVCAELKISPRTFYRWRAQGTGPRSKRIARGGVRVRPVLPPGARQRRRAVPRDRRRDLPAPRLQGGGVSRLSASTTIGNAPSDIEWVQERTSAARRHPPSFGGP